MENLLSVELVKLISYILGIVFLAMVDRTATEGTSIILRLIMFAMFFKILGVMTHL